jgi:hypothetical protein
MYKILLALAVVAVMASGVMAGEVSQATLSDMGLSNMQSMSDQDGMAVRGAWAIVGGFSFATTPGAGSANAYTAGDLGAGPDFAVGASVSASQSSIVNTGLFGIPTSSTTITAVAGGGAIAFAGP